MAFENERICVLYGSQTGNAQDLAERIWRESRRFYFTGPVKCMDDYDVTGLIEEKCVIFVCSTTGQGEEPDNMKNFWKFLLRRSLPSNSLANMRFAVLGLGDSSYVKFNFAAKRLNKRLLQLGGQILISLGLGDDQHDLGYDAVADAWIESLWVSLLTCYPLPCGVSSLEKHSKIIPRWGVLQVVHPRENDFVPKSQSIYYSTSTPNEFSVVIKENVRTTNSSHFQDVRLIKLSTNGEEYGPGDVLSLRPKNLPVQVEEFQRILRENGVNISQETRFRLSEVNREIPIPAPLKDDVTFQQLCEEYFDLTAVPRRRTFEVLAQLTDSELEREKCLEFTTAQGQDDLYSYCNRPKRNIVEVLADFPHATKNLTAEMLFEVLTPIKPRDFSIASSYRRDVDEIHILVAVVKYRTKLVKERFGLCSNYLADLKPGDRISVWTKKGSFRFPKSSDIDAAIMVGPGTGVAPFRNYISECVIEGTATSENLLLFYGCRGRESDFHCGDEFLQYHNSGKLNLICAFSREQPHKIYVQHKIKESMESVWKALAKKNAYIFVAGNSKNMPREVRQSFVDVCIEVGKMTEEEGNKYVEEMEKRNRYQTETWF